MLDPLAFALTAEGAALTGRVLLDLLSRFEGRQLATFGTSGVPLMQSAIALGGGRYHGLLVRKEPKAHGARKRVEGRIDRDEPVVLIDDTVSSGGSLEAARAALAEEGLFVEGAAVLVRFSWLSGAARLVAQGFHLEAAFDLDRDLRSAIDGSPPPAENPLLPSGEIAWSEQHAPEQLSPVALARLLLEEQLATGKLLRPPRRLDRACDARGGAIVSVRSGEQLLDRHARAGFWRLPGDEGDGAAHEIALACWKAAQHLPKGDAGRALLREARIGLTLFGALREAHLGEIDHRTHGIVLSSAVRSGMQAGALPNLPGVCSAAEQLAHAQRLSGLTPGEPFALLRHTVTKHVEAEASWPVGGAPDALDGWVTSGVGEALTRAARSRVLAARGGRPESEDVRRRLEGSGTPRLPAGVDYVFLTLFADGVIGACVGARPDAGPEPLLDRLVMRAFADPRSAEFARAERFAVELSFLHARFDAGAVRLADAGRYVRPGLDAIGAVQGERSAILLPAVAAHANLDRDGLVRALLEKAGIAAEPFALQVWRCAGWIDDGEAVRRIDGTFPVEASAPEPAARLERLFVDYLLRNVEPDGRLPTHYEPFQDRLLDSGDLERQAFVAWVLTEQARRDERAREPARRLSERLLGLRAELEARGPSGPAMLLCILCEQGAPLEDLASFARRLQAHPLEGGLDTGHVLVALGKAQERGVPTDPKRVAAGLHRLRHRFRHQPGMRDALLPWAVMAHAAWAPHGEREERERFVREAIDVALQLQDRDGAFQTTTQEDAPGCTSAPMLEAIAAALQLSPRPELRAAFGRGLGFLDGLVYQERDTALLPNPGFAEGGLRYSSRRATVRIDFVAHALHALGLAAQGGSKSS